jgi:hypothetical protein
MIQHATLEIDNTKVEQELKFWKALGFYEIAKPDGLEDSIVRWLQHSDGSQVHLYPQPYRKIALSKYGHIAFVYDDVHGVFQAMGDLPFPVVMEPGSPYWGAQRLWIFSPTGQKIEVMEYGPPTPWGAV